CGGPPSRLRRISFFLSLSIPPRQVIHYSPPRRSSDLGPHGGARHPPPPRSATPARRRGGPGGGSWPTTPRLPPEAPPGAPPATLDRKSTRLNSSHVKISYAAFCLKKNTVNKNMKNHGL